MRSTVPHGRGSTTSCPLSSSVAESLLCPTIVNGVMPSSGPANHPSQLEFLGGRVHRTVAMIDQEMIAWMVSVVMAPSIDATGVGSPPLVCSCAGIGGADV
jgi:hypothetical protein